MTRTERPWPNRHTLLGVITCKDEQQLANILESVPMIERMANVLLVEVGMRGGDVYRREVA